VRCPECGKENKDNFKFCLGCGSSLEAPPPQATAGEDPVTALLTRADDYERFEMLDEAIGCLRQALDLAPSRGDLRERLEVLVARKGA
jgi:hypothetical protein